MSFISVKLSQGTVLGRIIKYSTNTLINAFKGIPYAQPPTGPRRFKPPVPIERFPKDPLECFENGPISPQILHRPKQMVSEDCLHLNVYTPNSNSKGSNNDSLPVMVWFFGGAFKAGDNSDISFPPEFLVEHGVIVVTVNYRLGAFGFLSYPNAGIMGNQGLKDQRLALKWISENIQSFGGDSNNVTIFGNSAGATSCHLHLLNQESRNCFHKIILQSASALSDWAFPEDIPLKTVKVVESISKLPSATFEDPQEVYNVLMTATTEEILQNSQQINNPKDNLNRYPLALGIVIEKPSEDAFLTQPPAELLKSFPNHTHPMMIGFNSNEGNEATGEMVKPRREESYQSDDHFLPLFVTGNNYKDAAAIKTAFREFYLGSESFSCKNVAPMAKYIHDRYHYIAIRDVVYTHVETAAR